ncbi:MAG: recombinase family protein [Clostridiales bacterium]|jgi:site-specific recombinase, resolvase family|nr:recombinase family protein [Clostridiales bacterium]
MRLRRKTNYTAAIYLRISRDDGDKVESDSIQNQRELINEYLKKHPEITKTREFVDDGYSGSNFERPSFIRMMTEIENRTIDCVVVKDLSRFGRNYIETGKYLERIFPVLEVRFLSVNDNYDSMDEKSDVDQIVIPFKNLINDAYCRDISIKIRSQLDVKRRNGKFIGSFASYGYKKDPANKNKLIIDEYPAEIVKTIFNMKLEGYSANRIADRLNELEVLTPMEYKRACGFHYNSGYNISRNPVWNASSVTSILTNEVYTGTCVQGKNRKINYKVKVCRPIAPDEWIRVANTHEAIIPRAVYDRVQELLTLDTRTSPGEERVNVFSGLIRCGDCGQNLVKRSTVKNGKKYYYYHCTTYKNALGCTAHLIRADRVYETVLSQIQLQIGKLIKADAILKTTEQLPGDNFKIQTLNHQLVSLKAEIDRYTQLKLKLYRDLTDQIVSKEEYCELNHRFSLKIEMAKKAQAEVEEQKAKMNLCSIQEKGWLEDFKQYGSITELDRKTAVTLIEKIVVYDKNTIEIKFRYMDEMELMITTAEGSAEQRERSCDV